jgi:ankyrin repeat protein
MIVARVNRETPRSGLYPKQKLEVGPIVPYSTLAVLSHYILNGSIYLKKIWRNSSPLVAAAKSNNCLMVRELLHAGVDTHGINAAARDGSTALFVACSKQSFLTGTYLLEQGADENLS